MLHRANVSMVDVVVMMVELLTTMKMAVVVVGTVRFQKITKPDQTECY